LLRFYCDYCDTYLTHDSPSVRKTHCSGRKHKENVKDYYQKWMEEQAQSLIDKTSKANPSVTLDCSPVTSPVFPLVAFLPFFHSVPGTDHPLSDEPFPNVQFGLPLMQLRSISLCPFSSWMLPTFTSFAFLPVDSSLLNFFSSLSHKMFFMLFVAYLSHCLITIFKIACLYLMIPGESCSCKSRDVFFFCHPPSC
uniref:Small nuclear ribonucleoprotein polypeptide C n=1 Tax=Buteo japonicus TaxID=224669 RepID=A0A8C0AQ22_9AVES